MDVLELYYKSKSEPTPAGEATRTNSRYRDRIIKEGSPLLKQVESPTMPSTLTPADEESYEEQVFREGV